VVGVCHQPLHYFWDICFDLALVWQIYHKGVGLFLEWQLIWSQRESVSFVADHIRLVIERYSSNKNIRKVYGVFSILLIVAGFILIAFRLKGQLYFMNTGIYKWLDQMSVVFIPMLILMAALYVWNYKKEKAIQVPFILTAVILNFLFMVAATCVPILDTRFVKVIDFVFIMLSVHYLISYTIRVFSASKNLPDAV